MMNVAFVTGGASGIGKAVVKRFLRAGIQVGFLDMNQTASKDLFDELSSSDLVYVCGDVRKVVDVQTAVKTTLDKFGQLNSVVTCAGVHAMNTIRNFREDEWSTIFDTNVKGTIYAIRESLPSLEAQKNGAVVLVSADQALIGKTGTFVYGASKGAIAQMTRSLAVDLAAQGIRVNAVCPGTIRTPMAHAVISKWAEKGPEGDVEKALKKAWEDIAVNYPLRRVGEAAEVAELIHFLATDVSSFITGGLFPVDGGLTCGFASRPSA